MHYLWAQLIYYVLMTTLVLTCIVRTDSDTDVDALENKVGKLARQVMLQQLFLEERIRSDGDSGIKQTRINNEGTKSYHLPSISSKKGITSLHDHSNHVRTIGLGEFIAVLNGVEFRTRHNDFLLRMPSTQSRKFLETENIPYPDVPPEVTSKPTVEGQIKEMQKWFRAWHEQDHKKRDYRKYFKPVLCYLEGTWIDQDYTEIIEPFVSDRHWLDASSFENLQDKILFTSYNGRKSSLENFAWLPTTIMDISANGTNPKYAQWIYRIACHPLKRHIPTNRFRMIDDLSVRMMYLKTMDQHILSRKARFQINPRDTSKWRDQVVSNWELIDDLMGEVPGMDNYGGNLTDEAFDNPVMEWLKDGKVNTAYYHRWWKEQKLGAMGLSLRKRAYADHNLFMAMTSQTAVLGKSLKNCQKGEVCKTDKQRWSYAIPLEVIYMTPLSKWNPYNITYHGDADKDPEAAYVTENDSRFGGISKGTAYNGTNSKYFYQTPASFFEGRVVDADKADTFRGSVGVLDKNGIVRAVTSSGIRALLPNIPGIGIIRQRYPIMPLHNEGNSIWKELDALKDIVMEQSRYLKMYRELPRGSEQPTTVKSEDERGVTLELSVATKAKPGPHVHQVHLSPDDVKVLKAGRPVVMITTEQSSHSHMLKIFYKSYKTNPWIMFRCDGEKECWDGHKTLHFVKIGQ